MSAEEAAQMLHDGQRVAVLARSGAWRISQHGITIRPLVEESLTLSTALVVRSDNQSRILSEFTRAYVKKLSSTPASQLKLKLVS